MLGYPKVALVNTRRSETRASAGIPRGAAKPENFAPLGKMF
jgi:hypothetical protein